MRLPCLTRFQIIGNFDDGFPSSHNQKHLHTNFSAVATFYHLLPHLKQVFQRHRIFHRINHRIFFVHAIGTCKHNHLSLHTVKWPSASKIASHLRCAVKITGNNDQLHSLQHQKFKHLGNNLGTNFIYMVT